jgi:hypothetical protein
MPKSASEIIQRAITDPAYAAQLKQAAEALAKTGLSSANEHEQFLSHFANSPDELQEMLINGSGRMAGPTTLTTVTTATTGACATTTTTTITTTN